MSEDSRGFAFKDTKLGAVIDCLMPGGLDSLMSAFFLCRCDANDRANGSAALTAEAAAELGWEMPIVMPSQVHGTEICSASVDIALPKQVEADGVFLSDASVVGALRYADCAPILLASADPHPWMMVLHSGFKGTDANILSKALDRAAHDMGDLDPLRIFAWIGPTICADHYDRKIDDPSTLSAISRWHERNFCVKGSAVAFDIKGEIRSQAEDKGIPSENIFTFPLCTACRNDLFYSYRRGDKRARHALFAKLN